MIAVPQNGCSQDQFEELLTNTKGTLIKAVAGGCPSHEQFEELVFETMQSLARNTPFENLVCRTSKHAFPDIGVSYYGVEVKRTNTNKPKTSGNSVFETHRPPGIKIVYLMICWDGKSDSPRVDFKLWQNSIDTVTITHSPRYHIDIETKQTLFDKIKISYDEFRHLEQTKQMAKIGEIYADEDRNLWWLSTQDKPVYRAFNKQNSQVKWRLVGETIFLCPEVFGNDNNRDKYNGPVAYLLSRGFVCHNVRDFMSSGGRMESQGQSVPAVVHRTRKHISDVLNAVEEVPRDTIRQFWHEDPPNDRGQMIGRWCELAELYNKTLETPVNRLDLLFKEAIEAS